jgi:hypothetical protein
MSQRSKFFVAALLIAIIHFLAGACSVVMITGNENIRFWSWLTFIFTFPMMVIISWLSVHVAHGWDPSIWVIIFLLATQSCCYGFLLSFLFCNKKLL